MFGQSTTVAGRGPIRIGQYLPCAAGGLLRDQLRQKSDRRLASEASKFPNQMRLIRQPKQPRQRA